MAAVPLFRDTNMAAVTSRENTLYVRQPGRVSHRLNIRQSEIFVEFQANASFQSVPISFDPLL